jgi:multidrug efflux system outer membrane protein
MRTATLIGLTACGRLSRAARSPPNMRRRRWPPRPAYKELGPWQPAGTAQIPPGKWWELFGDPTLNALEAADRGRQSRPRRRRRALRTGHRPAPPGGRDLLPKSSVGANASRQRVSANRPLSGNGTRRITTCGSAPSLAYEIDLFGRVRNSVAAARAGAQASAPISRRSPRPAGGACDGYFRMRGLDARIALLRQTVEAISAPST